DVHPSEHYSQDLLLANEGVLAKIPPVPWADPVAPVPRIVISFQAGDLPQPVRGPQAAGGRLGSIRRTGQTGMDGASPWKSRGTGSPAWLVMAAFAALAGCSTY